MSISFLQLYMPYTWCLAQVLSTGTVGISDRVLGGDINTTLAMRTCDTDGTLLQPAKPLTPSERMYTQIGQVGAGSLLICDT